MFATARNTFYRWFGSSTEEKSLSSYNRMASVRNLSNSSLESADTSEPVEDTRHRLGPSAQHRSTRCWAVSRTQVLVCMVLVLQSVQLGAFLYVVARFGPEMASTVTKIHNVVDRKEFVTAALSVEQDIIPALDKLLPTLMNLPHFINSTQATLDGFSREAREIQKLLALHFHWDSGGSN